MSREDREVEEFMRDLQFRYDLHMVEQHLRIVQNITRRYDEKFPPDGRVMIPLKRPR